MSPHRNTSTVTVTVVADTDPTTLSRVAATVVLLNLTPSSFRLEAGELTKIAIVFADIAEPLLERLARKLRQLSLVASVELRRQPASAADCSCRPG